MIREVIGFDIPSFDESEVEQYRDFLGRCQETFRNAAAEHGFLANLQGIWLKKEDLSGGLPTHFLLEHLPNSVQNRCFLEEHRFEFPIITSEQLADACISVLALHRHNRRFFNSPDLDVFAEALLQHRDHTQPPRYEMRIR